MNLVRPIRRINTAKTHYYVDGNKTRVPGVTTILGNLPKDALINWAANATAEAAVDLWDDLTLLSPSKRLERLKKARYEEKDAAARRGTEVHAIGEKLVAGETVEVPVELEGHAAAYARLLDEFKVEPVAVEFGIGHYKYGYAGSGDLIADVQLPRVGHKRLLIDLKTNKSGIFGETAMQLAAYRYAEVLLADDTEPERPMIEVDGCAAVHIRPDGAELIPVTADDAVFRSFLYLIQVSEFVKISRDLIGNPIRPEGAPFRLVRDEVSA